MNTLVSGEKGHYASNIPKYMVYKALRGITFGLITATWVIYLQQQHGLNLTQVTLVDVAFWIAATLGELPTGIVADSYSRKTSLIVGMVLMAASMFAWTLAPTVAIIVVSYVVLAIGVTFLSGADDALFFESLKASGRAGDYTRLVGRVSAISLGMSALGNLASGLLATIDLRLPFLTSALVFVVVLGIVLTFKEPPAEETASGQARKSYGAIIRESIAMMRARPALRAAMFYLALVPLVAMVMETIFLQPQLLLLGVPLAGVGAVVMVAQFVNMAGSTLAHRIKESLGERRVLTIAPLLIVLSLVLLAVFQQFAALSFVAVISFSTAIIRPLVMGRIQHEVPNSIRATILSMHSLMFAVVAGVSEPLLGIVADQSGLPAAYVAMAGGLGVLVLLLLWRSRAYFP